MTDSPTRPAPPDPHRFPVRNLVAASAGNAIEWFDWTIFALFSTFFATQFFPSANPTLAYINTAATFALAFFFRPLGGWLIGRFSDRAGRKPALLLTITLMCGGSLVIALAPTFATIGWLAPILLLVARIAQGISTGGEVGNAYAYLYEIAPADRKGRYSSFCYISTGGAILLASLLGYWMTSTFSKEFMTAWGWRVPFLVGAVLGVLVLWLRRSMDESTEFDAEVAGTEPVRRPLLTTLREHPRAVLQILGFIAATTLVYYTLTSALKAYATTPLGKGGVIGAGEADTFLALSIGLAVFIALQYPFGALADRIGRRNLSLLCCAIFAVLIVPLSWLITPSLVNLIAVFVIGLGLFAMISSVAPAVLADLMPANLRGVGIGAWYNIAIALFGGTAPLLLTALSAAGHQSWFFLYIGAMCLIGVVALISVPDERRRAAAAAVVPADQGTITSAS
jgi:MFS transporter, MHS family, alpha-ketoglutarate permease